MSDSSAFNSGPGQVEKAAGECTEHWWAIEGEDWVCTLCGKSEKAQPPSYVAHLEEAEALLARLVEHADAMEAQHEDYHNPEGPLRSQVLCEAMHFLETLKVDAPAVSPDKGQG